MLWKFHHRVKRLIVARRLGKGVSDPGQAVSRILSARTGQAGRGEGHLSYATQPGASMGRAIPGSLFGLAPNGVYRAPAITLGAVGSYPTFSPLPGEPGGLFSVALAVGDALKRRLPRVSRPQGAGYAASCPTEFGLSSPGKPEATLRPPGIEERRQATAPLSHKQAAWLSVVDFGQACGKRDAAIGPLTNKKIWQLK